MNQGEVKDMVGYGEIFTDAQVRTMYENTRDGKGPSVLGNNVMPHPVFCGTVTCHAPQPVTVEDTSGHGNHGEFVNGSE